MITPVLLVLMFQAYDPLSGSPPPAPAARPAAPAASSGVSGYASRPASYVWPELWPNNYQPNWRGGQTYEPRHLNLTPPDRAVIGAYYKFAEQAMMGQNVPGHRPEEHRNFGPNGLAGRIGELKLGQFDTWKGRATKSTLSMAPYDGRFEIIGEHPIGNFACKQVKFTMSRGAKSVSDLELYCRDSAGKWEVVT